jgi:WD40 repeat protein
MQSASSGAIYKVAFNRLGDQIATGASDGTVRIWDARTGRERIALEWHPGRSGGCAHRRGLLGEE